MGFYPPPFNYVQFFTCFIDSNPQILIFHGCTRRCHPSILFPFYNPWIYSLFHVVTIRKYTHLLNISLHTLLKSSQNTCHLHPIICWIRLSTSELKNITDHTPTTRSRISQTTSIGVYLIHSYLSRLSFISLYSEAFFGVLHITSPQWSLFWYTEFIEVVSSWHVFVFHRPNMGLSTFIKRSRSRLIIYKV